uniref:T-box domain-containing protein n=2 Tax=Caenorhabditis tropicalis TaxID=1561998 RepID=A0A1I7UF37_9PELO
MANGPIKVTLRDDKMFEDLTRFPMEQRSSKFGSPFHPKLFVKITVNESADYKLWIRFEKMSSRLNYTNDQWQVGEGGGEFTHPVLDLGTVIGSTYAEVDTPLDFHISNDVDCTNQNTVHLDSYCYYQPVICVAKINNDEEGKTTFFPTSEFIFHNLGFIVVTNFFNQGFIAFKKNALRGRKNPEIRATPWIMTQLSLCSSLIKQHFYEPCSTAQRRVVSELKNNVEHQDEPIKPPASDIKEDINLIEEYWNHMHEVDNMGYFPNRGPSQQCDSMLRLLEDSFIHQSIDFCFLEHFLLSSCF